MSFFIEQNINNMSKRYLWWKYYMGFAKCMQLFQNDFRRIPLSQFCFPAAVAPPATRQILAFLVQKSKECWQKAPPSDSCVTTRFKSFFSRRISKVIPSHKLCICYSAIPMVTKRGDKNNTLQISTALLFNPKHKVTFIWTLSPRKFIFFNWFGYDPSLWKQCKNIPNKQQ